MLVHCPTKFSDIRSVLRDLTHAPNRAQRDLSHAPVACARVNSRRFVSWSELKNTRFLDFSQLFHLQSTRFFTTFMVVITYVTIPTYKYPSKLPHFLTTSHILTLLLTISPYESLSFLSFFSLILV